MVGDKIEFSGSGLREVESIQYSAKYMNIYVSGSLLNPITDGYPNKFVVVKSEGGK
ncbi:MAG: hypothetical protein IE909_14565 [Campylobacterales bacterium]|nr:hypothetical protein [Campylobacterales bacterium]